MIELVRDHPRVCGEHSDTWNAPTAERGSSPRMRGTHRDRRAHTRATGIIPAYAGNTFRKVRCRRRCRDHPRVCGEHPMTSEPFSFNLGSSPRMRGTRIRRWGCRRRSGIIPAYAGNTAEVVEFVWFFQDHPRVCGEHYPLPSSVLCIWGSSPRMRGTLNFDAECELVSGIIPAYAGNTAGNSRRGCSRRDHPRVCGEHVLPGCVRSLTVGSSPRMRGTPLGRR